MIRKTDHEDSDSLWLSFFFCRSRICLLPVPLFYLVIPVNRDWLKQAGSTESLRTEWMAGEEFCLFSPAHGSASFGFFRLFLHLPVFIRVFKSRLSI